LHADTSSSLHSGQLGYRGRCACSFAFSVRFRCDEKTLFRFLALERSFDVPDSACFPLDDLECCCASLELDVDEVGLLRSCHFSPPSFSPSFCQPLPFPRSTVSIVSPLTPPTRESEECMPAFVLSLLHPPSNLRSPNSPSQRFSRRTHDPADSHAASLTAC
jgi:hypothetical protein